MSDPLVWLAIGGVLVLAGVALMWRHMDDQQRGIVLLIGAAAAGLLLAFGDMLFRRRSRVVHEPKARLKERAEADRLRGRAEQIRDDAEAEALDAVDRLHNATLDDLLEEDASRNRNRIRPL